MISLFFLLFLCALAFRAQRAMPKEEKKTGRKVYSSRQKVELTSEDCDRLAEESDRYRKAISAKLDRLDRISAEDLKIRVK